MDTAKRCDCCLPGKTHTTRWNVKHDDHFHGWAELAASLSLETPSFEIRPLIFAAHPDDETIGASALMMRFPKTRIAYLTDGAPRDRRFRSPDASGSREQYANLRLQEASAAMRIAGLRCDTAHCLGVVDQEAIFDVPHQTRRLAELLSDIVPDVVITHPYEGGHPDHDAAALIAMLASDLIRRSRSHVPALLEMTSYHARDGQLITGTFLGPGTEGHLVLELRPSELLRKRLMIDSFRSQRRVLQSFTVGTELLRIAPRYDFEQPPHAGKLWYECLGWQMTGNQWRSLAAEAITKLEPQCA